MCQFTHLKGDSVSITIVTFLFQPRQWQPHKLEISGSSLIVPSGSSSDPVHQEALEVELPSPKRSQIHTLPLSPSRPPASSAWTTSITAKVVSTVSTHCPSCLSVNPAFAACSSDFFFSKRNSDHDAIYTFLQKTASWLPIVVRIKSKHLTTTFKILHDLTPASLNSLLFSPLHTTLSSLGSCYTCQPPPTHLPLRRTSI